MLAVELEPLAALALAGPADVRGGVRARAATVAGSGSLAVVPSSVCSPACSVVSPSGVSSAPMPGVPSSAAATGPLFLVALRTRNVTKPPTRSTTSTSGITYSMARRLPLAVRDQTVPVWRRTAGENTHPDADPRGGRMAGKLEGKTIAFLATEGVGHEGRRQRAAAGA